MVYPEQSTAAVDNDSWDFPDINWGLEPDLVDVPVIAEADNNDGEVYNPPENNRPIRSHKKKLDGIAYADLEPHFNKPLGVVAKRFKVCENTLRTHCKKFGIRIWPYEKKKGECNPPTGPMAIMEERDRNVPGFENPILYDFEEHKWVRQHS